MRNGMRAPVGIYEKAFPAEWPWDKRLAAAGEAGYDFVEISIDESNERLARLDWPAHQRAALRRAVESTGIRVLSMCLSGHRKFPLGSHQPEIRSRALDIFRKAIDFAADVGLGIVQVAGYDVFYEPHDSDTEAHYLEGLQRGTEWAAGACVMLGLENVDVPVVESVGLLMKYVREIDSPWFQVYPDMGNVAAAGYHPPAELPLAKGHLVGLHVKDAAPKVIRGIPFGEGIVPFEETFAVLAGMEFTGPMLIETWGQMDRSGDLLAAARQARQFVARQVDMAWNTEAQASLD